MGKYDEVVEVIRYIRPEEVEDQNLYGITILYSIDYINEVVKAKWSVCRGDNFDKNVGKSNAEKSRTFTYFDLDEIKEHKGLTNALVVHLKSQLGWGSIFDHYEFKHRLFSEALK